MVEDDEAVRCWFFFVIPPRFIMYLIFHMFGKLCLGVSTGRELAPEESQHRKDSAPGKSQERGGSS